MVVALIWRSPLLFGLQPKADITGKLTFVSHFCYVCHNLREWEKEAEKDNTLWEEWKCMKITDCQVQMQIGFIDFRNIWLGFEPSSFCMIIKKKTTNTSYAWLLKSCVFFVLLCQEQTVKQGLPLKYKKYQHDATDTSHMNSPEAKERSFSNMFSQ